MFWRWRTGLAMLEAAGDYVAPWSAIAPAPAAGYLSHMPSKRRVDPQQEAWRELRQILDDDVTSLRDLWNRVLVSSAKWRGVAGLPTVLVLKFLRDEDAHVLSVLPALKGHLRLRLGKIGESDPDPKEAAKAERLLAKLGGS